MVISRRPSGGVRQSPASWLSLAISGAGDFQVARSLAGLSHAEGTMSSILVVEDQYFLAMDCVREVERRGLGLLTTRPCTWFTTEPETQVCGPRHTAVIRQ